MQAYATYVDGGADRKSFLSSWLTLHGQNLFSSMKELRHTLISLQCIYVIHVIKYYHIIGIEYYYAEYIYSNIHLISVKKK